MVMAKTSIEPLLQPTVTEPTAPAIARASVVGPAFDEHLRQLQTTSQPPEPRRPTAAADDPKESSSPAATKEPTHKADESDQASPATDSDKPDDSPQATESSEAQEPATADSETAPADDDASDTEAASGEDNTDTDGQDLDATATAAAASGQVQTVLVEKEGDQPTPDADGVEPNTEGADRTPDQEVLRLSADKRAAGDAKAANEKAAQAAAVDEQATDTSVPVDDSDGDAKRQQPAAAKPDTSETKHHAATDARHQAHEAQGTPAATVDPESDQQTERQPPVVSPQDGSKPVVEKSATRRHTATTAKADPAPSSGSGATVRDTNTPKPVTGAATIATAGDVAEHVRSTDDAGDGSGQPGDKVGGRTEGVLNSLGRFHRGSSTGQAGRAREGQQMPRVDASRFVGRVARAFETAQQRGGTLHLRLSPPELGSLKLELTVKHGVMTASLETETSAARQTLLHHLPTLRERLAEQNIRIDRFDVDVRQDGGGQSSMGSQQQHYETASHDAAASLPRAAAAPTATEEVPTTVVHVDGTGINLIA